MNIVMTISFVNIAATVLITLFFSGVWGKCLKSEGVSMFGGSKAFLLSSGAMTCGVLSSAYVAQSLHEVFGLFEGGEIFAMVLFMPFFVLLMQITFLKQRRC
jgi:hypothetical protein